MTPDAAPVTVDAAEAALITGDAADAPTSARLDPPFEALSSGLDGVPCEGAATNQPFKRIARIGGGRECGCTAFVGRMLIWATRNR